MKRGPRRSPSANDKRRGGGPQGHTPGHRPGKPPNADQSDFSRVCGLAAVSALFQRAAGRVERLFFTEEMSRAVEPFCRAMAVSRRPFRQVGAEELARVAGTILHGGVAAVARKRPLLPFDPGAALSWTAACPLLVVLDGVSNPHNFGAIARSAAFFGLDRMVVSDHPAQAAASDAAHRVAEGGLEFVQLYRAQSLPAALRKLRPAYRIVGAALGQGLAPDKLPRDRPIALVLGNEEAGLGPATLAMCDNIVTLPGSGAVQSLNVSAAAAILIYALG